jgi:membrane associated rhomboid family serine protease
MRQIHLPTLSLINKFLIITSVAFFLLSSVIGLVAQTSLLPYLALSVQGLSQGFIHTLVTFPLIEGHLLSVVFNGLILWFLGSELEWSWGPRRYLSFVLASFVGGMGFFLLISLMTTPMAWLAGLGSLSSALCVAYALMHPDRQFIFMLLFPMKAKYFCLLLAGISLYQGLFSGSRAQAFAQLGAMLAGYLFMGMFYQLWGQGMLNFAKKVKPKPRTQDRSHLKLVKKDDDDTPKYWH